MKHVLLLAVTAAACGGGAREAAPAAPAPPASHATCAELAAPFQHMSALLRAQVTPDMNENLKQSIETLADAQPKAAASACTGDTWTSAEIQCYLDADTNRAWDRCDAALTPVHRTSYELYLSAYENPVEDAASAWPWKPVAGETGVIDCDDYLRAIDAVMACDALPAASRQAAAGWYRKLATTVKSGDKSTDRARFCGASLELLRKAIRGTTC